MRRIEAAVFGYIHGLRDARAHLARSFARETSLLPDEDRRALLHSICGFACGLTARLRGEDEIAAIAPWVEIGPASKSPNVTNLVLDRMGRRLLHLKQTGVITPIHYAVVAEDMRSFGKVQGACERISTTPVPFAYSLLIQASPAELMRLMSLPLIVGGVCIITSIIGTYMVRP